MRERERGEREREGKSVREERQGEEKEDFIVRVWLDQMIQHNQVPSVTTSTAGIV